jgi:hypothetical protein
MAQHKRDQPMVATIYARKSIAETGVNDEED